jgi:hypothetical protein
MRPTILMSLAMLGLTALLVVLSNNRLDNEGARGDPLLESYGIGLLAACAVLVVALSTTFGKQTWPGYALVPITSGVAIVGFLIGVSRFD